MTKEEIEKWRRGGAIATEVDHWIPVRVAPAKRLDYDNLRKVSPSAGVLCKSLQTNSLTNHPAYTRHRGIGVSFLFC